ncbi:hypothetical protein [Nodosilinea sp. P-1105]|uniref:hypothetical protein n=1 Tax=Nodosilinea sp. P-1105 TaxID=2546229 RepID=UPI00146ACB5C|nr:hypothetical protein [Nodosilinea sp. P-1105]NMF83646.1 hypothetical protein [Nodosilinea sp. P-1105]
MYDLLIIGGGTFAIVLALTILLGLASKLGKSGEDVINYCSQAPGLDFVIIALIVLPWVLGGLGAGWSGLASAGAGQVAASQVWVLWHSWICRQSRPEVGINAYLSQRYGWWRNHLALWITAVVLPMFFLIRAVQVLIYPLLVWLLNFKSYDHSEWINVSRQKFEGLVGHDLMWCLYCDWMTGVYSLGAEMLRNVESFWCPIRFYNGKKCENCSLDFPAIDQGWVTAEGTMPEVVNTLDATIPRDRPWRWSEASDNAANKV